MKRWLSSRNIFVGHNPSHEELLAMVESKMHEPTSSGFDDPNEWSEEDMKEYLRNVSTDLSLSGVSSGVLDGDNGVE